MISNQTLLSPKGLNCFHYADPPCNIDYLPLSLNQIILYYPTIELNARSPTNDKYFNLWFYLLYTLYPSGNLAMATFIIKPNNVRLNTYTISFNVFSRIPFRILDITLTCIWWWGSSPGALEICSTATFPLLPSLLWPLIVRERVLLMSQIEQHLQYWNYLTVSKQMNNVE